MTIVQLPMHHEFDLDQYSEIICLIYSISDQSTTGFKHEELKMPTKYEIETQCDHATFFKGLPEAIENRPFEVMGNTVQVFDHGKVVNITVSKEELKKLGSLELPMERIVFNFPEHTPQEAESFMNTYRQRSMRCGGG